MGPVEGVFHSHVVKWSASHLAAPQRPCAFICLSFVGQRQIDFSPTQSGADWGTTGTPEEGSMSFDWHCPGESCTGA